jgi:hypothetical protein
MSYFSVPDVPVQIQKPSVLFIGIKYEVNDTGAVFDTGTHDD